MYFNALIIAYNLTFTVYSTLGLIYDNDLRLVICPPIIELFLIFMVTNFTIRYYQLARVMHVYFNRDIEVAIKASKVSTI